MKIESYEARKENDQIRIEIIRMVMQISSAKILKRIKTSLEYAEYQERRERPMDIIEIAEMMDIPDMVNILSVVSDADTNSLAAQQIKEAFSNQVTLSRASPALE